MKKVNAEIMKSYLGNNPIRDSLDYVHEYDGHYYASNGVAAIKVPVKKCATLPEDMLAGKEKLTGPDGERIQTVFENAFVQDQPPKTILLSELKAVLDNFKRVPVYEDCPECEGSGYRVCDCCGSEIECPDCFGDGVGPATGEKELENKDILFEAPPEWNSLYNPAYDPNMIFHCLYKPLNDIGAKQFKWLAGNAASPGMFEAEGVHIIIMPRSGFSDAKEQVVLKGSEK